MNPLLNFIGKLETGETGPAAYGIVVFHQERSLPKPLTDYTIDEILAHHWVQGSAAGKYQIIRDTLRGLVMALKLDGATKFNAETQDRLGYELLRQRGFENYIAGTVSLENFALALAKEWASIPVLTDGIRGAHKILKAGESYYAGDGVNKSQARVSELLAILRSLRKPQPDDPGITPEPSMANTAVTVDTQSAWLSTKNWAAIVGILSVLLPFAGIHLPVGWGDTAYNLIAALSAAYILVKNTWFTTTITSASAKKL